MFRQATLPPGWKKTGSDHDMWSYVEDERGLRRVAVFYKAAFYDRRADMHAENVPYSCASQFGYSGKEIPWDLLTVDETTDTLKCLVQVKSQYEESAAQSWGGPDDAVRIARITAELAKFPEFVAVPDSSGA
jgi:hypothetical protein